MRRNTIIGIVIGLLLFLPAPVGLAQNSYPSPQDPYINDYARLMTPADAAHSRALLADLKEQHGIEATVVTIESLADYATGDETIEAFATGLFNTWGIGDAAHNDGVLLLVAVAERKVRIEVGAGYESSQNRAMQAIIDQHIVPDLRQGNMSRGIYQGVRAIVGQLTGTWPPEVIDTGAANRGPLEAIYEQLVHLSPVYYVGIGAVAAFGLYRFRRYRRQRPRMSCPHCKALMKTVMPPAAQNYLDEGQRLEEEMKTMRHKVWLCPKCRHHILESYPQGYQGITRCPQCKYRTVKVETRTEVKPTYNRKGRRRVYEKCQYCDYVNIYTSTIAPAKKYSSQSANYQQNGYDSYSSPGDYSSSSSSHSDFGGGSSAGDGASGDF
ncbi:MAG: TPM domain-containing protein [Anaerolineae bacterium]|nr:TPM domain-containing protein [Anaerolineae bacterium]